ncbi:TorD/DmsD family molecular chaperone [Campylobacter pinnipediorum]|uniref:TorD/DmsD family molecular chaperone n=1 Tax=Campylobacter pinnipediorum TaxID=1965231 RepID=UPI00099518D8|nr:molecular chaperone TorD family protein [Campylobacter pinnipediorum]AQW83103.1 formate dehydrogenase-associated chaperone [Campylobacter pinnipediorum subsp. pinnipediorum]
MTKEDKNNILNARKIYYLLFSKLFVFNNKKDRYDSVFDILNTIKQSPLDETSSIGINNFLENFTDFNALADEYDDIFHAPPRPLHNTFSYYEEGYSSGSSCVRVRKLLSKTNIRRDEKEFKENEDNVGFVFSLMFDFISYILDKDEKYEEFSKELFESTINPFIDEFILNLYNHQNSKSYKSICLILQSFIEFERLYYGINKPNYENEKNIKTQNGISRSEMIRREANKARRKAEEQI